eukprot:scaffold407127_cov47-Prasinocladus_malaysianus.AAC.3
MLQHYGRIQQALNIWTGCLPCAGSGADKAPPSWASEVKQHHAQQLTENLRVKLFKFKGHQHDKGIAITQHS